MTYPNDPNQPPGGYDPPPPPGGGGYGPPPPGGGGYGPPPPGGGGYGPPPGGGYGPPPGGGGYGPPPGGSDSKTPMVLGIIGIVCWFCCSPAAIVLGLIGQSQADKNGQPTTLPRIAWIGGIVALIIGIIVAVVRRRHT